MVTNQHRVCEYSSDRPTGIETMEEFLQGTVPTVKTELEEFAQRYASQVAEFRGIPVCKHRKKLMSKQYRITKTGYLKAADIRLETPTLKVDPDVEDQEDESFRSGAIFMDEKGAFHIVEYYHNNSHNGFYAVDRGIFSAEQAATLLAKAYADRVGIHSNFFLQCFRRKLGEAKGLFR